MDTKPLKAPTIGSSERWEKLTLTAHQKRLWMETRTAALYSQPALADVWYSMMVDQDGQLAWFTDKIPIAATDDKFMYLNPKTFFEYDLDERLFICFHEEFHSIFNHCGLFYRLQNQGFITYSDGITLPYKPNIMQIAADCVINDILHVANAGKKPKDCWHQPHLIPGTKSVVDAYRILYKEARTKGGPFSGPGKSTTGSGGKSFDKHLRPGGGTGKTANQAESERNPQEWDNAVTGAMAAGLAAGRLPANIERLFAARTAVKTDWQELLQLSITKILGRDGRSWTLLDPEMVVRGIGFPGRIRYGCNYIIVILDTSGSINQKTLDYFTAHLQRIIETVNPRRLVVSSCDAKIHNWDEIDEVEDLKGKVRGGGGTSFIPPFDRIKNEGDDPDMVVYFTDLAGSFPSEPDFPVIWATINSSRAPWGQTIAVPPQSEEVI